MARDYHPKYVEDSWYAWWSKCGFNKPEYNEVSLCMQFSKSSVCSGLAISDMIEYPSAFRITARLPVRTRRIQPLQL